MHFGAQSRGLRAPCERFAPWVTPGPRITRFRLAADLGRMGLDTHRVSNKVSKITSRHLVLLDRAFPAHALVHGDFSPKNILISDTKVVIIDWEVAWFGDPAFDAAFLLSHLYLKAFYHRRRFGGDIRLAQTARGAYLEGLRDKGAAPLAGRVARLLLMLLLARIDGKSPVEYITEDEDKARLRGFATAMLADGRPGFDDIDLAYVHMLETG